MTPTLPLPLLLPLPLPAGRLGLVVSTGLEGVDRMLGLGQGFTAHPRIDPAAATLAGFSWASKLDQSAVLATVRE